ncbi:MAG: DNA primase [Gammaproteobacteria bacterium]|nr:DNA primase [Gammaproteobacteria bacterium]
MAGKIPAKFIDDLLARVDIIDIIDARVPLKKAGKDYKACCPFHEEKTPSFTVSHDKQFYHCFGCGVHGSAIGFLMEYDHMSFPEAVQELAGRVGMEVPRDAQPGPSSSPDQTAPLLEILAEADKYFRRMLREYPYAKEAVDYLKRRGLSGEIAADFGLGFVPEGWDNLLKAVGTSDAARSALAAAGLIVKKDNGGFYDRFRHRVMFPIHDHRGRLIGFGGRILDKGEPKYLNSPETPLFHKGRELYGLYRARDALKREGRALVVEGYMDVVALAQFGIDYAVATLGTATTRDHLERLFRYAPEVVFCFDGDRAGREAAWRALESSFPVLHEGRQVSFLFLPDGEDPDSLVRKEGKEAFSARVSKALSLPDYFYQALAAEVDFSRSDAPARMAELARPLLSNLRSDALRHLMLDRLGEKNRLAAASLRKILPESSRMKAAPVRSHNAAGKGSAASGATPLRRAIQILLQRPQLAAESTTENMEFLSTLEPERAGVDLLRMMIDLLREQPTMNIGSIIEHFRDSEHERHIGKLAESVVPGEPEELDTFYRDAIQKLRIEATGLAIERLLNKERFAGLSDAEKSELKRLLAEKNAARAF